MSHTSRVKPVLTTLGAGVFGLVILAAPMATAGAHTDEPDGVDIGYARHGNVVVSADDPADASAHWRRQLNEIDTPPETTPEVASDDCVYDPRHLPHTADAIDGWFRDCRARN